MPKQKPQTVEWNTCEDEREWSVAQARSLAGLPQGAQSPLRTHKWRLSWVVPSILVLLMLLLVSGWTLWQQAQKGIDGVERELSRAVNAELRSANVESDFKPITWQEKTLLNDSDWQATSDETVTQVELRDLGSNWATVEVWIQPTVDAGVYRQTRLYRASGSGWLRAEVTAEYWGEARTRESNYFLFHYRAVDEEAVTQVAARIDALYPALYASLFADSPPSEKQAITIDPEQEPGMSYEPSMPRKALVVASPAATLRPVEVTAGDLLLQSLMLTLYGRLAEESRARFPSSTNWLALHDGLRLWLIWEHELPLAHWRQPLVWWIFDNGDLHSARDNFAVTPFAQALCLQHSLWMHSPLELGVPIICWQPERAEGKINARHYSQSIEGLSLAPLIYKSSPTDYSSTWQPVLPGYAAIELATAFEYIAATYGSEQIPRLLAEVPAHMQVETLIPAVFGVSLTDFDRGWQAFLAQRYN